MTLFILTLLVSSSPNEEDDHPQNSETPDQVDSDYVPSNPSPSESDAVPSSSDVTPSNSDGVASNPDNIPSDSDCTLSKPDASSSGSSDLPTTSSSSELVNGIATNSQRDQEQATVGTNDASSSADNTTRSESPSSPPFSLVAVVPVIDEMVEYDVRPDFDDKLQRYFIPSSCFVVRMVLIRPVLQAY